MKLISEPIDIYGQNIYNGQCIRMGKDGHLNTSDAMKAFQKQPSTGL